MLGILDIRMRHARNINNIPFGGVPVLFVGDFSQLPPVMAKGLTYKLLQMIRKKSNSTSSANNCTNEEKYVWQRGCNVF